MKELSKIVRTGHYSNDAALQAMKNLRRWAESCDCIFLENLFELGGVPKVLAYLENNTDNAEFLTAAARVITRITYPGPNDENVNISEKIAKTFVKRNGIRFLLFADGEYIGGDDKSKLIALGSVWCALQNITGKSLDVFEKDQLLAVTDTGLDTLGKLSIVGSSITSVIMVDIFYAISHSVMKNIITPSDFEETTKNNLLSKSLGYLKNSDGGWNRDSNLLIAALNLFSLCFLHKNIFFSRSEFEAVIPLCAETIKQSPTEAHKSGAFRLIEKAIPILGKSRLKKSSVDGALIAVWESDGVNEGIQQTAGDILKLLHS